MQNKSRRATAVWLVIIGMILGVVVVSGAVSVQTQAAATALYLLVAMAAMGVFGTAWQRMTEQGTLRRKSSERTQVEQRQSGSRRVRSSAASRAQDRARTHPTYLDQFTLIDTGLIASEIGPEGMRLKRDNVTLDDQGVQPYAVIHADDSWSDETVAAVFEILDPSGDVQFRHAQEVYLREGQNNIMSENRLPLGSRMPEGAAPGLWEMRVTIADSVIALHTFSVGPSTEQRRRMIQADLAQRRGRLTDDDAPLPDDQDFDSPVSLEDLLGKR